MELREAMSHRPDLRPDVAAYFTTQAPRSAAWRTSCFDDGRRLVEVAGRYVPVAGARVLDIAAGWGGHALAFAEAGATVVASDLNDHDYVGLGRFADALRLPLTTCVASCQDAPFEDGAFDIILGLELMEHIPNPDAFASEVARLLAPGGVCIVTTPAKLRSGTVWGEPHYQLRYIALLPFRWQAPIARRVFRRSYPFPIERQYALAASVTRPFKQRGLTADVHIMPGKVGTLTPRRLRRAVAECFWGDIVIRKHHHHSGSLPSYQTDH